MTDWLLPLLYSIVALGLGVLCLPVALSLQVQRDSLPSAWKLLIQLAFLRGGLGLGLWVDSAGRSLRPVLLGKLLPFPTFSIKTKVAQKKKRTENAAAEREHNAKAKGQTSKRDLLDTLRLVFKPGLELLISLPQIIGFKSFQLRGSLGFSDPSQTGRIHGYLQALASIKHHAVKINIIPDFTRPGAFGQLNLVAHCHLGLLLLLLGRFGIQVVWRFLGLRLFGWKPSLI